MTTLHLVRHGQSTWNEAGLLQGQASGPVLTPLGHEQAQAAADVLASLRVEAIYSSDQVRAAQTAAYLAVGLGVRVELCAALRERAYGVLEGQPSGRAAALAGDVDWLDPDAQPGAGESLRDVHTRVDALITRCVVRHPAGAVVLVSHGDTIRVIAACLAGRGPHEVPWLDVANGSVTTLAVRPRT